MKIFLLFVVFVAVASAKPAKHTSPKFGYSRPNSRIVNGHDAKEGEFPHQISYQWGLFGLFQHVCGGTIISPNWILTAGHCVTEVPEIGDHMVVAGITNLWENVDSRQQVNVVQKIVHPDFSGGVGPNDLALLQLETPLELGSVVQAIKLPVAGDVPTGDVVLSGWGDMSTSDVPNLPAQLQTVSIPLLSFDECNSAIEALLAAGEDNPLSQESNICTGPLTGVISGACSGDSGGPLIQDDVIVGIVSWGFIPCGSTGAPSVFTKVSNFVDFISEHVTDLPK